MPIPQNQQNLHNKDDKLVIEVTKELDSFKQRFFRLIDKAQGKKIEQLEAHRKMVLSDNKYDIHYVDRILDLEYELLSDLVKIYRKLVDRYVVDLTLFEWPKLLLHKNNPETLSKLYMVTFARLQEIQERLCQIIPPIFYSLDDEDFTMDADNPKDKEKDIDVLQSIMFGSTVSKPIPTFEQKLATFEKKFLH
jgi:hypothetical protein